MPLHRRRRGRRARHAVGRMLGAEHFARLRTELGGGELLPARRQPKRAAAECGGREGDDLEAQTKESVHEQPSKHGVGDRVEEGHERDRAERGQCLNRVVEVEVLDQGEEVDA
eukprot:scaffold1620_cov68-Phaeocystis_antarctica.AAC.2